MGWYKGQFNVKCPYYLRESDFTISCESIYEGVETVYKFATKERKESFQENNCNLYPNQCVNCQMVEKKYYGEN